MPGWHEATKKWVADGKLQIIGIIQEQHPERCRLFAQWKDFDWPIVHDPINLIGNSAVPIAIAIDENGIVRSTRPRVGSFESDFLNKKFDAPDQSVAEENSKSFGVSPDWESALSKLKDSSSAKDVKDVADAMVLWAPRSKVDHVIELYQKAFKLAPKDSSLMFRLGVAYLMRYESVFRKKNDFSRSVTQWTRALKANPNQYIWRRRIQQYGPRLDKPYPFYDWVVEARKDIKKKGGTPIRLPVEPVGAELASRSRTFTEAAKSENPDPKSEISKDPSGLVAVESAVVPHTSRTDQLSMAHVIFTPKVGVEWSNEAGPLVVWIEGKKVKKSQQLFQVTNKEKLESNETRKIEFEISRDKTVKSLSGFALYYVCENSGECRYLRQDFTIELK